MSQNPQLRQGISLGALESIVSAANCRIFGWRQAGNGGHRQVLAEVIKQFDHPRATVLCEPSMTTHSMNPPDVVLIDWEAGVHVIEVKAISLSLILDIHPGGEFEIQYPTGTSRKAVIAQVRRAMFAVRSAFEQQHGNSPNISFNYWVVFPHISRSEWKWSFCPPEILFQDDLATMGQKILAKGKEWLAKQGADYWPDGELEQVRAVFGDNAAITNKKREPRPPVGPETLGGQFDERAFEYKNLSREQQDMAEEVWEVGPRLIRGVAGSGKTVVLAANLTRRLERIAPTLPGLGSPNNAKKRIGVFCFNRALVPFLREKVENLCAQRGNTALLNHADVTITHLEGLYRRYGNLPAPRTPWAYRGPIEAPGQQGKRASAFLTEWRAFAKAHPQLAEELRFDGIYVDEGQDLHPIEIELLGELARKAGADEPNLIIFYDDAQNLYGRARPTWSHLGLNVTGGRAQIMKRCYRNPRSIVEPAFNTLYGTHATGSANKPTKEFGDIPGLERLGLIRQDGQEWRIEFARQGQNLPVVNIAPSRDMQFNMLVTRLKWLIIDQEVRPSDILVLAPRWEVAEELAARLGRAGLPQGVDVHLVKDKKDEHLCPPGKITLSTVHSAKGYDAYAVLLADVDQYEDEVNHRALFYVGCTRAMEWLEVFASSPTGLVLEMQRAVDSYKAAVGAKK